MSRSTTHRLAKSLALVLPLCVGGAVWWLAGQGGPVTALKGEKPPALITSRDFEVRQESLSPASAEVVLPEVFSKFDAWAADYAKSAAADRVEEGVKLAQERRDALHALIKTHPREAIAQALPWRLRNRMPTEIVPLLEKRISTLAEYSVKGAKQAPEAGVKVTPVQRSLIIDGKIYAAYTYGRREWLGTKNDLPVEGIAVDESLAMMDRPMRLMEVEEPLPPRGIQKVAQDEHQTNLPPAAPPVMVSGGQGYQSCCPVHTAAIEQSLIEAEDSVGPNMATEVAKSAWTEGAKQILVIRVDFSDVTGTPQNINPVVTITPSFATNLINGVTNTFMSEVSYGKTSVNLNSADVTAVLRMPRPASYYTTSDPDQLRIDSLAAARSAGYDTASYDRQMVVFSWIGSSRVPGSSFSWAGLGQINGPFTWYNGYFDERVVPHELGHNLSLYHANLWRVFGTDPVDTANGTSMEYQDPFDCMGNGFYAPINLQHFNPWFLNRIDWLPNGAVQTVAAPGLYRVYRFDTPGAPLTRPLALKIVKDGVRNYWLGYRRRFAGVSGGLADISAGAYVIWGFNTNRPSQLIDVNTPGTNPNDASLNVGATLRDTAAGMVIRVVAAGGSGVDEYLDIRVDQDNRIYPLQTSYDVDEAAGSVTISLARSGEPNETSIVSVTTQDASAVAPSDYTATSVNVEWNGTDTSVKTVTIPIVSNAVREPAESFRVVITLIQGASSLVAGSPVTVNIREPGMSDSNFSHNTFASVGSVRSLVVEPDGQVAFAGGATTLGTTAVNGIGRLTESGELDASFNRAAGADPLPVLALVRQADGKFVVGGAFTSLRGVGSSRVGRLENDGGIDSGFDVGDGAEGALGAPCTVRALAVQADGRILVGGDFVSFDGTPRLGLARLMPDGSLDETFLAVPLADIAVMDVESIVLQADGKVLVGGLIHSSSEGQIFAGGLSSGVLRLNADGTLDSSFDVGAGAHATGSVLSPQRVMALALQSDGKVVAGGAFTAFRGTAASRVVRLNTNGTVDTAFTTALTSSGASGLVRSVEMQGDGRILLAGDFTALGGSIRYFVGRLLATGAVDSNFDIQLPLTYGSSEFAVGHVAKLQPDAKVLVATQAPGAGDTTLRRIFSGQLGRSGVVEFTNGSVSVNEGGQAQVEVRRTGGSLGAVSVNYDVLPGTADDSDFVATKGTLTWANGDSSARTITVQAQADEEAEETEYFDVQLGVPIGGVSLGDRALSTVAIADPGAAGFATVRFVSDASSLDESATASVTVTVELSAAAAEVVTIPVLMGGLATNAGAGTNGDYNIVTSLPLVFSAGQTSKTITINSRQDNLVEGAETLTLRFGFPSGPVLVGSPNLHTVTLVDDDQPPSLSETSAHRIVALGSLAGPFEANVAGSLPLTTEWYLNNRRIAGATTPSYSIASATLKDAGTYFLKAKNRLAESASPETELVVVDASTRVLVLPVGAKATMKADASGNGISYSWRKVDGNLAADARITTRADKTLNLPGLKVEDSGTYICRISSPLASKPNGEKFMDGGIHILKVVDTAPEFLTLSDGDSLPVAIVSGTYSYPIEVNADVNRAPMSYTGAGLPAGLKVDAVSGRIVGKPTAWKAVPYDVTLTVANKAGRDTVKVKLKVDNLPAGLAGDYLAVVGRKPALNQDVGGRLDLKITATGAFTGKLLHGGLTHALKGSLDVVHPDSAPPVALPSALVTIVRTGKPAPRPLSLSFEIDPATRRISTASITDGFETVEFAGWKQTWDAKTNKADAFDGYHTFVLEMPDAIPNVPRGYGFGTLTVSPAGVATIAGKTGDGETVSASGFISETGEVAVFQALYKTKPTGSLLGTLQLDRSALLADDSDNRIGGSLNWLRPATSGKARVYKAGFGPLDVTALGGRYLPKTVALDLPAPGNLQVSLTHADLAPARADATFLAGLKNKIAVVTASLVGTTLVADSTKGTFSGKLTLEDFNPTQPSAKVKRPVTYQGVAVLTEQGWRGLGNFLLPQLPSSVPEPPTTPTTSPILSGKALLAPISPP